MRLGQFLQPQAQGVGPAWQDQGQILQPRQLDGRLGYRRIAGAADQHQLGLDQHALLGGRDVPLAEQDGHVQTPFVEQLLEVGAAPLAEVQLDARITFTHQGEQMAGERGHRRGQ
ncbi:hypothetical protein D3C78_1528990 [compost metagenome]